MTRQTLAAVSVVLVLSATAPARGAEVKPQRPVGTWERKAGDNTVRFEFKPDGALRFSLTGGGATINLDGNYGLTKNGVLFGIVTKVLMEGTTDGPPEGHLFSFRFSVDKDTFTIKELKGTDNNEAKQLVEGDYKKK